jgi:hypothetical protein
MAGVLVQHCSATPRHSRIALSTAKIPQAVVMSSLVRVVGA